MIGRGTFPRRRSVWRSLNLEDQRPARICVEEPIRAKVVESAHGKALRTTRNGIRVRLAKRKKKWTIQRRGLRQCSVP